MAMKGGEPIYIDNNSKIGILLIHGFTSTPHQFKDLSKYLSSNGFSVYAPLITGHGTKPEDLVKTSPEDWKKSVKEAYLKLKEKTGKVIVVGNSFGGNLAFWLAKEIENEMLGIVSLGTPIVLKYQMVIRARLFLYGWARKYYRKPMRIYKTDYTDMMDEVTYPLIPVKNLREFLDFIKNETIPNLSKVKAPTFIAHADVDPVARPKSATYIYEHLGSSFKRIYWFESNRHIITTARNCNDLFYKILDFINELRQNNHN
jgi:carboxylesterase